MVVLMLSAKSSLEDADLSNVYSHFVGSSVPENAEASFKKNEKVGSMAKSMLKHRIQSLTGKNIATIEKELGVPSPPEGPGLDVESLRKLSYWLILEANGSLTSDAPMKRNFSEAALSDEVSLKEDPPASKKLRKPSRHSTINETLNSSTSIKKTLTKGRRKSMAPGATINPENDSLPSREDPKPTQAMLDVASRRSRGANNINSSVVSKKSEAKITAKSMSEAKKNKPPKTSFSGAVSLPNGTRNEVFIAQSSPFRLKGESITDEIPSFPGASLCLIHTPEDWMSPEIYLAIESVVNLNRSKGLDKFLLMVKCDVDNVASTRLSLTARFTEHVQFMVLHCTDPGPDDESPSARYKMKETCTSYFLAYFFPGCDKEGSVLKSKMMRDEAMTNCISARTEEDLENKIIDAFTEPGDWILDLAGRGISEIILSAQKTGRNGIVIDDDEKALEDLQEKAVQIANYHDKHFREVDGDIIQLK